MKTIDNIVERIYFMSHKDDRKVSVEYDGKDLIEETRNYDGDILSRAKVKNCDYGTFERFRMKHTKKGYNSFYSIRVNYKK